MSPQPVLKLYHQFRPEIVAVLDHPQDFLRSEAENRDRWRTTLRNTAWMARRRGDLLLAPVVHAASGRAARYRCQELKAVYPRPPLVCIGGLVPLFKQSRIGQRFTEKRGRTDRLINRWSVVAEIVGAVRQSFPHTPIHVFGAGSLSTLYMLLILGVNSFDSVAWRVKAAYGAIQLPGTADRFFAKAEKLTKKKRRPLSEEDASLLQQCRCPSCRGKVLADRMDVLGRYYWDRATHNAFVFQNEVALFRKAANRGKHLTFIVDRMRPQPRFRRVIEEILLPFLSREG